MDELRILIAYEANFRACGDALERAIRGLRPGVRLAVADLEVLAAAVEIFDPHLVVSDRPNTVDLGGRAAWYVLSHEPGEPSEVCLDALRSVSEPPLTEPSFAYGPPWRGHGVGEFSDGGSPLQDPPPEV